MTFQELGLKDEVLRAVDKLGFVEPSEIQSKAVPQLLTGEQDFVGLAQTGTGKTAAFGLPLASLVDFNANAVQALVICPTRELCLQISRDLENFTTFQKKAKVVAVYGGASIEGQLRQIKKGVQIIVATPGRLLDFIRRRAVDLSNVRFAVLDEADEMLNMGFKEDIDAILEQTPSSKKTWLFSATMPPEVARIAKTYMFEPFEVTVGRKNSSANTIYHQYSLVQDRNRYMALKRLLDFNPDIYGIVFCQTRYQTRDVAEMLTKDGYNADGLHGDLSQAQRDSVMRKFREKSLQILVATDVAARGIDVDSVSHVIHYSLPDDVENYTHRSGRTGRAGKKGVSMALVSPREVRKVYAIEKILGQKLAVEPIPSGQQVCEKQLLALIEKVKETEVKEEEIEEYMPAVYEALESFTAQEIVMKFISAEFNRFLKYYKASGDLNVSKDKVKKSKDFDLDSPRGGSRNGDFKRFFINIGLMDKVEKGEMLRLVCDATGIKGSDIGRIDLKREFSFFEVHNKVADKVRPAMKNMEYGGRQVRVEDTKDDNKPRRSSGGGGRRERKPNSKRDNDSNFRSRKKRYSSERTQNK